jgi:acetyl-CoA carboxylase carboxyltransferase component
MDKNLTVGNRKISSLFDAGSFVEIGAYVKRRGEVEAYDGVICGYGSVSGKLAFAFVQDSDRTNGAFDEAGAKKIEMLYDMAIKNGAAVVGVFDSAGAAVADGSAVLSAYGRFISCVSRASRCWRRGTRPCRATPAS